MKKIILSLIGHALALWILTLIVPGIILDTQALIIMAIAIWLLNTLVKPILKVLALPFNFLTFGLFSVVIDIVILYICFKFVPGAWFNNYMTLALAAIILGILNSILGIFFGNKK